LDFGVAAGILKRLEEEGEGGTGICVSQIWYDEVSDVMKPRTLISSRK
jgi:hypothetical protein